MAMTTPVQRPPENDVEVVSGGRRRRGRIIIAVGVVLLAAVASVVVSSKSSSSRWRDAGLAPNKTAYTNIMIGACRPDCEPDSRPYVGQRHWVGFAGFDTSTDDPVKLRSARIRNVPDGMKIVSIRATTRSANGGHFYVGAKDEWPGRLLRPLDKVPTIKPRNRSQVYLQIEYTFTKPGTHKASVLEVDYQVGPKRGTRAFPHFSFGAYDVAPERPE